MINPLFQLDIPKRSVLCSHQKERFLPGESIYSLLLENEDGRILRQDFCTSCWLSLEKKEFPSERRYWKWKLEEKSSVPTNRVNHALLLFKELMKSEITNKEELFILALFLARARQLALRQEFEKEGTHYQLYELVREEQFFTIEFLHLTPPQIMKVKTSLAHQLENIAS